MFWCLGFGWLTSRWPLVLIITTAQTLYTPQRCLSHKWADLSPSLQEGSDPASKRPHCHYMKCLFRRLCYYDFKQLLRIKISTKLRSAILEISRAEYGDCSYPMSQVSNRKSHDWLLCPRNKECKRHTTIRKDDLSTGIDQKALVHSQFEDLVLQYGPARWWETLFSGETQNIFFTRIKSSSTVSHFHIGIRARSQFEPHFLGRIFLWVGKSEPQFLRT